MIIANVITEVRCSRQMVSGVRDLSEESQRAALIESSGFARVTVSNIVSERSKHWAEHLIDEDTKKNMRVLALRMLTVVGRSVTLHTSCTAAAALGRVPEAGSGKWAWHSQLAGDNGK
eukprot:5577263-Amphidinium_carterae.1